MLSARYLVVAIAWTILSANSAVAQNTASAPPTETQAQIAKVDSVRLVGDQFFYLELPPGSKDGWCVMVRKGTVATKLVDPSSLVLPSRHAVIFDIEPSWNGRYVAVGASLGPSEGAIIRIVDVATGALLKDSIVRSFDGSASWADDDRSFYYRQFQQPPEGSARAAVFDNMRAYRHMLGDDASTDKPVFGADTNPEVHLPTRGAVNAFPVPGTSLLLAVQSGAPTELDSFWVRDLSAKQPQWRQVMAHRDEVLFEFAFRGSTIYFITHKDAPNGRLMAFDLATEDITHAREILSQSDLELSNRDEDGVVGAKDALYVYGRRNGASVAVRIPYDNPTAREEIHLPSPGFLSDVSADYRAPGFIFSIIVGKRPPTVYVYDPEKKQSLDTHLQSR